MSLPEEKKENLQAMLAKISASPITPDQALEILTELKVAIQNKDEEYIKSVCLLLANDDAKQDGNAVCERFLNLETPCKSLSLQYTTPEADDEAIPENYIQILEGKKNSCEHAYVYVDERFEGFLDGDIHYLAALGVANIDIIRLDNNNVVYKGPVDSKKDPVVDRTKREGWLIFIGVIIFIGLGLLLRRNMN